MSEDAETIRVLHVDDEIEFAELTARFLEDDDERFTVATAMSAADGLEMVRERPPDCVVSDYNMPGMDGLEFLSAVRESYPELPFVLFTGRGGESVASDAISAGVTDYLQKGGGPERYELLANRISNAVDARRDARRASRQEELMRLTEFAGDTGGWEIQFGSDDILLTAGAQRILGLADGEAPSVDDVLEMYHPDDRAEMTAALERARETGTETRGTWRLQTAGRERVIEATVHPVSESGEVTAVRGAIHDVTERTERNRELEEERQFIEQALDTLDDLFYVVGTDGRLRRWNSRAVEVSGYTDDELDGMPAVEVFPEDHRARIVDAIETVLSEGRATVEADVLTADGERIPYEFVGAHLTDTTGTVTGLVGVGRDLRERREREERFRAFVEGSSDIISVVDENGRFQYQSPSVEHVLGYAPEDTIGDPAFEYIHPDDRMEIVEAFERAVGNPEETPVMEYRTRDAEGSWRWMEARGNNHLSNPAIEGYVVNSRDVTERKRRERELQTLKAQYQTLVDNVPMGVFLFDEELQYTLAGGDELASVGLSPADFESATPHDLFPEDLADELAEYYRSALDGATATFEQRFDGKTYRIETLPIRGEDGEVVSGMAVSQNITERRRRERKLERQNERLKQFAGIVSHDLRNPLNVATGALRLVEEDGDSEHLPMVADSLERMEEIVEDTLTLAQQGRRVYETEPVRLPELLDACWGNVATADAALVVETDATVRGDPMRLRSLFETLFRNSVEHGSTDSRTEFDDSVERGSTNGRATSDGGGITVRVGVSDGTLYVEDDGPGIPESERDRVFEPGYSANDHGTGFGLPIVEEIAGAHGWNVTVSESDDGGARFEFENVERSKDANDR